MRGAATALGALLGLLGVAASSTAAAHSMPGSAVYLDVGEEAVEAELQIPLGELEYAFGSHLTDDPARRVAERSQALGAYLASHVQVTDPGSGAAWRAEVVGLGLDTPGGHGGGHDELRARLHLTPSGGASPRAFDLHYDAVLHEVRSHRALVFLRSDVGNGAVVAGEPPILAMLQLDRRRAEVRLSGGQPRSLVAAAGRGRAPLLLVAAALLFALACVTGPRPTSRREAEAPSRAPAT